MFSSCQNLIKDTFFIKLKSPVNIGKENMEKHDLEYYLNIRMISAGMGIEYAYITKL